MSMCHHIIMITLDNNNVIVTIIREVADDVGISFGSFQAIFTAVKIFPKLLNFEQKQRCMDIVQEMLTRSNDDSDLLKKVIAGKESWVYGYDIETKVQSSQPKRPVEPIGDIKEKSKRELLAIPKSAFQKCFKDWKKRRHKCIISVGGYFEGDKRNKKNTF